MAGSHFSHLTMQYEELESQKKLLLSSYAHKKCHAILCPHMVSSQQARYPLDKGSVCVCSGVYYRLLQGVLIKKLSLEFA